jgi:hypothetical protein
VPRPSREKNSAAAAVPLDTPAPRKQIVTRPGLASTTSVGDVRCGLATCGAGGAITPTITAQFADRGKAAKTQRSMRKHTGAPAGSRSRPYPRLSRIAPKRPRLAGPRPRETARSSGPIKPAWPTSGRSGPRRTGLSHGGGRRASASTCTASTRGPAGSCTMP